MGCGRYQAQHNTKINFCDLLLFICIGCALWEVFLMSQICVQVRVLYVAFYGECRQCVVRKACVCMLYTDKSCLILYLWLPRAVQHFITVSLHRAACALCSALWSEETIICIRWLLQVKLNEGNVLITCEFII